MTLAHPLQLHLFDANPDPAMIPPERRQRLVKLTGELLLEALKGEMTLETTANVKEIVDE